MLASPVRTHSKRQRGHQPGQQADEGAGVGDVDDVLWLPQSLPAPAGNDQVVLLPLDLDSQRLDSPQGSESVAGAEEAGDPDRTRVDSA